MLFKIPTSRWKYFFEIHIQFEHAPTQIFASSGQHPPLHLHLATIRLQPTGLSSTLQPPVKRKLVDGEGKNATPHGNRTPAIQSVDRELTAPSPRVKLLSCGTSNSVRGCRPVVRLSDCAAVRHTAWCYRTFDFRKAKKNRSNEDLKSRTRTLEPVLDQQLVSSELPASRSPWALQHVRICPFDTRVASCTALSP